MKIVIIEERYWDGPHLVCDVAHVASSWERAMDWMHTCGPFETELAAWFAVWSQEPDERDFVEVYSGIRLFTRGGEPLDDQPERPT